MFKSFVSTIIIILELHIRTYIAFYPEPIFTGYFCHQIIDYFFGVLSPDQMTYNIKKSIKPYNLYQK